MLISLEMRWPHRTVASFRPEDLQFARTHVRCRYAFVDAKLRTVAEQTGATLLDPLPDVCGNGEGCSPFFGAGEPKFADGMHLRPIFVREHLRFLDILLK